MQIYYVEFTREWHLDINQRDQTEYLAFSTFDNLVKYLATLDSKDWL